MNFEDIAYLIPYLVEEIKQNTTIVPDWPVPGIPFKDITTIFNKPRLLSLLTRYFDSVYKTIERANSLPEGQLAIGAIEARGFVLGAALSAHNGAPLVLFRKPGKLPRKSETVTFSKEYGEDSLSVHGADLAHHEHILIIDDILATGGTIKAANDLARHLGVCPYNAFIYNLNYLRPGHLLEASTYSLIQEG